MGNFDVKSIEQQMNRINLTEIENKIEKAIEKKLVHTGIYYRIFGRVKTARSLYNKIETGKYGQEDNKLIQDVIGIRIILYFSEDLSLCHELLDDTYGAGEYSVTQNSPQTFGPAKKNGVYRLPKEAHVLYSGSVGELPVDSTFEVQLRTVSFEGWHEIEHDMRYKMRRNNGNTGILVDDQELSRMLNSVLASYELNDWALIRIFNELSYKSMLSKNWEEMLRTRFRIKIDEKPMNPHLSKILDAMKEEDIQKLYNCDRRRVIMMLREFVEEKRYKITYNCLVYVLNVMSCRNEEIEHYYAKYPLETRPLETPTLRPLADRIVYDGTWELEWGEKEVSQVADILYGWCQYKASNVFRNLPAKKEDINDRLHVSVPGYKLKFKYSEDSIHMFFKHPDMARPATIWMVSAEFEDGVLRVMTRYYSPDTSVDITHFSEPVFVKEIRKEGLFRRTVM